LLEQLYTNMVFKKIIFIVMKFWI